MKLKLVLENGKEFIGEGYGEEKIGKVTFNTSMVGYQQIMYDKANFDDIIVMTYTLIGNYGINDEDYESDKVQIKGMIAKEFNSKPSNFRSNMSLTDLFVKENVTYMYDLDTRMLTKEIRNNGEMLGIITPLSTSVETALEKISKYKKGEPDIKIDKYEIKNKEAKRKIACLDLGARKSIFDVLSNYYDVTVFPYDAKAEQVAKYDGIFLVGGPKIVSVDLVKNLIGKKPIFATGIGTNVLVEACGGKNELMKFGHRGGNHTIKYEDTKKNYVISQNHFYRISDLTNTNLDILSKNLLDGEIEGVVNYDKHLLGILYNLDNEANPEDFNLLLERFNDFMDLGGKKNA